MTEHALHFVIRRLGGGNSPPPYGFGLFGFFCLSAQSRTVMMMIPLPHYGNNFATKKKKKKKLIRKNVLPKTSQYEI